MRSSASTLLLGLSLLVLCGCPPDPATKSPAKSEVPGKSGPAAGPGGGAGGDDPQPQDPVAWTVIDQAAFDAMAVDDCAWPILEPMASVPSPASLQPVSEVPEAQRPGPSKILALRQLVSNVVAEHLRPADFDAALGVDARGRTYVKLGRDGRQGTATVDSHLDQDAPVFTIVINQEGLTTTDALRQRVAEIVVDDLADALKLDRHRIQAHPKVSYAGNASLRDDPSGFGVQFPWLHAFVSADKVVVILVEAPHMSLDPSAPTNPDGDGD
jgi:hypothetical protein